AASSKASSSTPLQDKEGLRAAKEDLRQGSQESSFISDTGKPEYVGHGALATRLHARHVHPVHLKYSNAPDCWAPAPAATGFGDVASAAIANSGRPRTGPLTPRL